MKKKTDQSRDRWIDGNGWMSGCVYSWILKINLSIYRWEAIDLDLCLDDMKYIFIMDFGYEMDPS